LREKFFCASQIASHIADDRREFYFGHADVPGKNGLCPIKIRPVPGLLRPALERPFGNQLPPRV
jgi:hypothetical protein